MTKAKEIGQLVDAARERAGLSQRALAEKSEVSQATLSRIISGDRTAKMPEIIRIAWATGETVAKLSGVSTVADRIECTVGVDDPGRGELRRQAIQWLELDDLLADEYIPEVFGSPKDLHDLSQACEANEAAWEFRYTRGLGDQPIQNLIATITLTTALDIGVAKAHRCPHALTMRDPRRGTTVMAVPTMFDPLEQRASVAHGLGHAVFGDWQRESPKGEWFATEFARHLLIPLDGLASFLTRTDDEKTTDNAVLSSVVQRFQVPPAMAAKAMDEGGHTDENTAHHWGNLAAAALATRYGWLDEYHSCAAKAMTVIAPQKLLARAVAGYEEGVVSPQALAALRGVDETTLHSDLATAGIVSHSDAATVDRDLLTRAEADISDRADPEVGPIWFGYLTADWPDIRPSGDDGWEPPISDSQA